MRKKEHLSIFFNLLLFYGMEVHELKSTWSEISATVSIMYFYVMSALPVLASSVVHVKVMSNAKCN